MKKTALTIILGAGIVGGASAQVTVSKRQYMQTHEKAAAPDPVKLAKKRQLNADIESGKSKPAMPAKQELSTAGK